MFEWDPRKAQGNAEKHGVTFEEALTVFVDEKALDGPDVAHSIIESRFFRLGKSIEGRILVIAYTLRGSNHGETIRIISARQAKRRERTAYAKQD